MNNQSPLSDVDASRRRVLEEYESILDALERALDEPLSLIPSELKTQSKRWEALFLSLDSSFDALNSVVRTSEARLRDVREAGCSVKLDETLIERTVAAKKRTADLSVRLSRRASEILSETVVRKRRRPTGLAFSRIGGTQIDIQV